ncbi:MAG: Hpt domain-containing protein, partial [Thermoleophilia bacterium]|nr:Hpt domain-containing protein [Thermoleophilia bacterium]
MNEDFDDLLPLFFEEGREHVENLNLSLLALERTPNDVQAINEAFRASHSLKGMAASMGFSLTTRLTHELESVLANIRETPTRMSSQLVSVMLAACDLVERLIDEIEVDGAESILIDGMVVQLQDADAVAAVTAQDTVTALAGPSTELIDIAFDAGARVFEMHVVISERSLMPGARAYAALRSIDRGGELIGCHPSREVLETGTWEGREVVCWVAADMGPEQLAELGAGREVSSVNVEEWFRTAPSVLPIAEVTGSPANALPEPGAQVVELRPTSSMSSEPRPKANTSRGRGRSVRVDATRLDELMHGVEEMLVRRSRLQTLLAETRDREIVDAIDALDRAARELQGLVMDVRMVSVDSVLRMLPRLVRDLGEQLGKEVRVAITGRETELDRTVVDVL